MSREKDLSNGVVCGGDNSQSKFIQHDTDQTTSNPVERLGLTEKGIDFLRESDIGRDGFQLKPSKIGVSGSQELTLSYLCDNSKLGFPEKEFSGRLLVNSLENLGYKGKEVVSENSNQDERWVERDFLRLNEIRGDSSKRENEEIERASNEKKPKIETLSLSLALPDVSLSLTGLNQSQDADHPPPLRPRPSRSVQSLAPSNNNTHTTFSNDFTAASQSYSNSHAFSHNPSCSLTRNSTENYEYSVGSYRKDNDQIWYCGEGTNGSVHSRFKPIGDGVSLSNHNGVSFPSLMNGSRPINKDQCNNIIYKTTSSDNNSFFPSELPARPWIGTQSGDSRGKASDHHRVFGSYLKKPSKPEKILREIVMESIPVTAQMIQELPEETIESTKEYLKNLIDKRDEFAGLQNRLERRSDLTKETLSKSHKTQLEILVSIKTGLKDFVSNKPHLPTTELVEIFLLLRCRNLNCKALLPAEDCECKICSSKKGFCSACMCPVCFNFDCANNTCSWVGCDVCSHWCHADCGVKRNLIKPGLGPKGLTGMQFHCLGCGHASEMFGFVKDVFVFCAKDWGLDTLMKELDCVRKIFRESDDFKGRELYIKADEMLLKLERKLISPLDACNLILQFFSYIDGMHEFPAHSSKDLTATQSTIQKEAPALLPRPSSLPTKPSTYNHLSSSNAWHNLLQHDLHQIDRPVEDDLRGSKKEGFDFDSLESIVRIKEAEARMFQSRADEARKEAERYKKMARTKTELLEEEYSEKLAKLCLQETEERRRKKVEDLKNLENSQLDYYKMKMRMQAEIAGLLERMEATKQQWV